MVLPHQTNNERTLRSEDSLILTPHRTKTIAGEGTLRYALPICINKMSRDLITSTVNTNFTRFKDCAKKYFLSRYSSNECYETNCFSCQKKREISIIGFTGQKLPVTE